MNKIILALVCTTTLAFAAEGRPRFDANGDKALDKTEWLNRAAYRFDRIDANNDGKVTRDEIAAAIKHFREKMHQNRGQRKEK